ncbi:MAG: hypothetical protein ABIT71_08980, partial [Vicinamibacteraceae bacterium]
ALMLATIVGFAVRALAAPATSPDRLVAELRLAQVAALVLALLAGVSVGLAVGHAPRADVSVEVALGGILFLVAAIAPFQDPRLALTVIALGFAAHAVTDVMHRPGLLPSDLAAGWYFVGSACLDAVVGALCYLPLLKR